MKRQPPIEELEVGVRAWAIPDRRKFKRKKDPDTPDLGPSDWSLVFDTETNIDAAQRLRVGSYQVRRGSQLRHAGIFYDPEVLTDVETELLRDYTSASGLRLYTREQFARSVFFPVAYRASGLVVGFNLPFDISRIAVDHGPARAKGGTMRGGFSFKLGPHRRDPAVQIKKIGSRAAFIRFAERFRGYFVDVATIGAALLSHKGTLGQLAETLGTGTSKREASHGQAITPEYLDYAMGDVQVTWECFEALRDLYASYGFSTPLWQIYSEASVGKAHLREMGLRPWREVQPRFAQRVLATIMESYYGGRTEGRIRRVPVSCLYLDFASQYPTSFVLQGLWDFLFARSLEWGEEPPDRVQRLLARVNARAVLSPDLWRGLHAIVLVEPVGDRLPTRARYGKRDSWNVALSYRTGGPPQWWTLADCIASKLMTGKSPKILRVLRFSPGRPQAGLRPIRIAGESEFTVDPYAQDPIKRLVELRAHVRAKQDLARETGDHATATRLQALAHGMKIAANSIAYGIGIEINVEEHRRSAWVTVYRPDGTSYRNEFKRTENLGSYFHPLVATLVTGGGRLLLATAMSLVEEAGGTYAYCDTDSLFVPATPDESSGPTDEGFPHLPFSAVERIADSFAVLNPFDQDAIRGSILRFDERCFDPTSALRPLEAWVVGSKRYSLHATVGGRRLLVGRSEHGLGHLLPALRDPTPDEHRSWIDAWWEQIDRVESQAGAEYATWFDLPLVGRHPISSQREESAFSVYNAGRDYQDRVRPFGFMIRLHRDRAAREKGGTLVAPFEPDPERWPAITPLDRSSGGILQIQVGDAHVVRSGYASVQTYADYFVEYRSHPEYKFADADGKPCHRWSHGPLFPRHIRARSIGRLGKESGRLTEGPVEEGAVIVYGERRSCLVCGRELTDPRAKYCSLAHKQRDYRDRKRLK